MDRAARYMAWGALLLVSVLASARADAQSETSTIYLKNGGKLRGEIVVDIPGSPLTVVAAGQSIQLQRDDIARIENQAAPLAQPAPPPALAPTTSVAVHHRLAFDSQGVAMVQNEWSPEVQHLVLRRNDASLNLHRKGFGGPIAMLSVGLTTTIITAFAANRAATNYAQCVLEEGYADPEYCGTDVARKIAIPGYLISSALWTGGGVFLLVRILRKVSLRRQIASIDQELRLRNVGLMANVAPSFTPSFAGLSYRMRF